MWLFSLKSSRPWPLPCPPSSTGGRGGRPLKPRPRRKIALLLFAAILALPGCANLAQTNTPAQMTGTTTLPARPELRSLAVTPDGGITMDQRDAAELLIYIEQLERAAGVAQ